MKKATVLCWLLACPAWGHADPCATCGDTKGEATATALAVAGSLAGPALMVTGFVVAPQDSEGHGNAAVRTPFVIGAMAFGLFGPSLGSWYAHEGLSLGLEVRLAGAGAIVLGAATNSGSGNVASTGLLIAGGSALILGTALDIADAHRAARDYNETHQLALAPTLLLGTAGPLPGLALGGRF